MDTLLRQAMSAAPAEPPARAPPPQAPSPVAMPAPAAGAANAQMDAGTISMLLARLEQSQRATADTLLARVEAANEAMVAKMEAENKVRRQKDKEEMKKLMETMVTKLSAQMEEKLTKAVTAAIARDLPKEVAGAIKTHVPLALEVHSKSPQYLETTKNAFTAAVTPAMDKMVKASSDKVVAGIKPALQESFKGSFQSSIIPAFESSCQTMFSQIHATFERGQAERMQADQAQAKALTKLEALQSLAQGLTGTLQSLETRAHTALAQPAAATAHASPAAPAPPPAQPQETIEQLAARLTSMIQQEKYDEVFSQVLSRSDLELVTWLCKKVAPRPVFAKKSLSAPVVLSLVQQLGFDLQKDADVKIQWLRDAVASLDPQDPLVGSHVPMILRDLQLKLAAMERNSGEFPITQDNDFRILMHVLRSVIG